ncbi:hypothetical protein E4U16_007592 [Claviceps sp. LM84 group G4]|nr:hypothetical protein E4U16_007592 [Claviceps sp. LM84 group G4]
MGWQSPPPRLRLAVLAAAAIITTATAVTTTTTTTTTTTAVAHAQQLYGLITCYAHNGTSWAKNTRCPGSDACCGADSTCYSNRLCKKPMDNFFVRGPCAVKSWRSGQCAQICREDEAAHGFPHVIVCLDGSYCCDTDGPQCCVEKRGVFLDATGNIAKVAASTMLSWGPERTSPGYQTADSTDTDTDTAATPPPGPESATSASPRETATGPSRDPGTPSTGEGESDNTALKIGVGVGIPLGLLALGACAALIVVLRRRRRRRRPEMGAAESAVAKKNGKRRWLRLKGARVSVPRELDATSVHRAELPP